MTQEVAILAGGCFWGMQELIRQRDGVLGTRVGYTGGTVPNATYKDVTSGRSGHAEAIEIKFDPAKLSYAQVLAFFFQIHDPTTMNRQGNDVGSQYRSAIFYTSDAQKQQALATIAKLDASKKWPGKIVTEVTAATPFYEAEGYHQDYLQKLPTGYTCHFVRPDWTVE